MITLGLAIRLLAAVAAVAVLGGCATQQAANPFAAASPLAKSVVTQWEKELATVDLREYREEPERSALVYRLIFISDYRFSRYEADLMLGKATRDSFIDMSMFGLNSAATLLPAGGATQILSALAGGLSFSRNTIEKNFYMNHAAPVLIARMRVLRKEKLNEIASNLRQSPTRYPIELAIVDVLDYYTRGTMLGALQSISNETSVQEVRAAGGEVKRPPAAPSVRLLYPKTAPAVLDFRPETLDTAPLSSEISRGRKGLGREVIGLRKAGDGARAAEILAAGGVSSAPENAVRKLADEVDSISSRSSLEKWEGAFSSVPPRMPKTAPPVVSEPLPLLVPEKPKPTSATPLPKQPPVSIPGKLDPL